MNVLDNETVSVLKTHTRDARVAIKSFLKMHTKFVQFSSIQISFFLKNNNLPNQNHFLLKIKTQSFFKHTITFQTA